MSAVTAFDVSIYFTNHGVERRNPLTIKQALQLSYLAQGFHLSLTDNPFFLENLEAWPDAPVSKDAYYRLKKLQNYNYIIDKKIREVASFDEKQLGILKVVFHKSLTMGWWGVSELIYKRDGPWEKAYKERFNRVIEPELIKNIF